MFSSLSKLSLAKAALFQNVPIYVQFYVTARCNLSCTQCNIIYANSDLRECSIHEVEKIAENLARLGTAIVLLTGGEPFIRKDLPEIVKAFSSRGIHVRMQTNGFASEAQIESAIAAGGKDISISLDSLQPHLQNEINGGVKGSWNKAIEAISNFSKLLPRDDCFASLGCVLRPDNIQDVQSVIEFGTQISWFTSLVPVHTTPQSAPRGFSSFNQDLRFTPEQCLEADRVLDRVAAMRESGYLLYDSDQYLTDIKNFIRGNPIEWRKKNNGCCDSPNLYFVILPNGEFAPCCDYRMKNSIFVQDKNFLSQYKTDEWRDTVRNITSNCAGCMYGSFPEMSIAMRYLKAKIQRVGNFFSNPPKKEMWPLAIDDLNDMAKRIFLKNFS